MIGNRPDPAIYGQVHFQSLCFREYEGEIRSAIFWICAVNVAGPQCRKCG